MIHFLLGFSWTGISFYSTIANKTLLVFLSLGVGTLFVLAFFFIINKIQDFAEDNSFKISETIEKVADVYLVIPGGKQGKGKIQISIKGSFREIDAMTEGEKIETGSSVKILRTEGDSIVIVQKI